MSQHKGNRRADSTNPRQSTSEAASLATKLSTALQNKKAQNLDKKCTAIEGRIQVLRSKINKKKDCAEKLAGIVKAAAHSCHAAKQKVRIMIQIHDYAFGDSDSSGTTQFDEEGYNEEKNIAITTIEKGREAVIRNINESGYKDKKIVQLTKGRGGPKGSGLLRLHDFALDMVRAQDRSGLNQIEETLIVVHNMFKALVDLHDAHMDSLKIFKDRVVGVRKEIDQAKSETSSESKKMKVEAAKQELEQIQKQLDDMKKSGNKQEVGKRKELSNALTDPFGKKPLGHQT